MLLLALMAWSKQRYAAQARRIAHLEGRPEAEAAGGLLERTGIMSALRQVEALRGLAWTRVRLQRLSLGWGALLRIRLQLFRMERLARQSGSHPDWVPGEMAKLRTHALSRPQSGQARILAVYQGKTVHLAVPESVAGAYLKLLIRLGFEEAQFEPKGHRMATFHNSA
jgi:hypothetical protein